MLLTDMWLHAQAFSVVTALKQAKPPTAVGQYSVC